MRKYLIVLACVLAVFGCMGPRRGASADDVAVKKDTVYPLGFCTDSFRVVTGSIRTGDNFTGWVCSLWLPRDRAYALSQACDGVFDVILGAHTTPIPPSSAT